MRKIEDQILNAFETALWRKVKRISRLPNKLTVVQSVTSRSQDLWSGHFSIFLGDRNQSQKVDKAVWEKYYIIFFWIQYWENKIVLEFFWIQTQIHLFLDSVFKNRKSVNGSQNRSKKIGSHKKSQNWSRSDFRSHQTLQWRMRKIENQIFEFFSVFRWAD